MSLMKCPECGHDMSSLAEACPNCGYKLVREETLNKNNKEEATNNNTSNNSNYMGSFLGGLLGYSLLRSLFRPRYYGRPMGPGPMGGFGGPMGHGRGPRF